MTRRLLLFPLAAALTLAACQPTAPDPTEFNDLDDQVAFIVGHQLGSSLYDQMEQLDEQDIELDQEIILAAVRAGLNGDSLSFSPAELDSIMTAFQDTLVARSSANNLRTGEAFLTENAARDSVTVTDSGLQYQIVEEGDGISPQLGDTVTVNYRGTLPDGTEFDSSYQRGRPAQFVVGEVIPGWNEALQLMKTGATWKLYIPSDIAYGEQAPPQIGPNRVLLFDVELLDVQRGPAN